MHLDYEEIYDFKTQLLNFLKDNNMNTKYVEEIINYLFDINNITMENYKDKISEFVKKLEDDEKNREKECQNNGHIITSFFGSKIDCLHCNKKWECKSCSNRGKEDDYCRDNHNKPYGLSLCKDNKKNCIECNNLIQYRYCCKN